MIKCCIFDLDGTLLDTLDTITYYVNKTLLAHGIESITREECSGFVGNGADSLIRRSLESRGIVDEDLCCKYLAEYKSYYEENPYYLTRPYDGIEELISTLSKREILLAVLSNKPERATRATVSHFFGDSFRIVFGGRDNIPLKPAPDSAFEILERLSLSPYECAYVGDTETDVHTAKNFGALVSIAVLWGFRTKEELINSGAECLVCHPREIVKILGLS